MKFYNPTPVQAASIPPALEGRDILGTAQTGTGKTGAFCIPMLAQLIANPKMDALVLAPTRELAAQIFEVLQQMCKGQKIYGALVVGGESFGRQAKELRSGPHYIVATPGRLNDHLQEKTVDLSTIGFLVLDEVDRMLDMGFAPQIRKIERSLPTERQTLLFSATLPTDIKNLAHTFLINPIRVEITPEPEAVGQIVEKTVMTTNEGKNSLILTEIAQNEGKILVFARTKSRTERLAKLLHDKGHKVVSLHGGRSQGQRKQALEKFRRGNTRIMVATDLAGRGIDVADIAHIINYDVPATREDYIHRIGRTARYGRKGTAVNFLITGDTEGEQVVTGIKTTPARVIYRSRRRR